MPQPCNCGGVTYIDWWYNYRTKTMEIFVRCIACQKIGPVGKTEEEAEELWRLQIGVNGV